ncbi:apolipoprotein D-like [Lucilia sericata]|uniref:apolipoprotein D-like n=1 Tax=Lucilia sericata TaxID=13632 RepID=UPI0018A85822|nr:apolipoprotein D-like [Lucilia sericata]
MRIEMSIFLVLLFGCIHFARCQVPFPNSCPEVKIVETFDLERYMGTWYEYSKYPFIFEVGQKCQQAVYKDEGNSTISVVNTGVYVIINKPNSAVGSAKVLGPGQLAVEFRNQQVDTPNYLVLGTDYDNWVVVYSCKNISSYGHAKLLWILTRQRQPTEEAISAAKRVIQENKLSETFLIKSTQTDCPNILEATTDDDQIAEASSTTADDQSTLDFSSTERVIESA